MPDDHDDIDSYWEGLRPPREPGTRNMSRYAKRVRESSELNDAQWDERARLLQAARSSNDPRAFTTEDIRVQQSVADILREELNQVQDPREELEHGTIVGEEELDPEQVIPFDELDNVVRQRGILGPNVPIGHFGATGPSMGTSVNRSAQQQLEDVPFFGYLPRDFSARIRTLREAREQSLGRPLTGAELVQVVNEAAPETPAPGLPGTDGEWAQLGIAREQALRILRQYATIPQTQEELDQLLARNQRRDEYAQLSNGVGPLANLESALTALGFPPANLRINSSQTGGTTLTIILSSSRVDLETEHSPEGWSVTFSHRF